MKVVFEPNKKYIQQLDEWLYEERNKGISKTYYNFINADFTINNFACLVDETDNAIGYIQYTFFGKVSSIDIAIIKKNYQKKGLGRFLFESVEQELKQRGSYVLKLFCEPHNSERIWKKLGFLKFKERNEHRFLNENDFKNPWLYKPIVDTLKPTKKQSIQKKIELWTKDEYKVKDNDRPNYVWDLTTYHKPIIYPVDSHWKIRFSVDGEEKYCGQIKRFIGGYYCLDYFLIMYKD